MSLFLELLGYYEDQASEITEAATPSVKAKRKRPSHTESDSDWECLLETDVHKHISSHLNSILNLKKQCKAIDKVTNREYHVNTNAVLFPFIKVIHYVMHLLYEDLKLNTLFTKDVPLLAKFLSRLAFELNAKDYKLYYFIEHPKICVLQDESLRCLDLNDPKIPSQPQCFETKPPSIMKFMLDIVESKEVQAFPVMKNVNDTTRNVIEICANYIKSYANHNNLNVNLTCNITPVTLRCDNDEFKETFNKLNGTIHERVVTLMTEAGIKSCDLDSFPIGINLLLHNALWLCREQPPMDWNSDMYNLLLRLDLANQAESNDKNKDSSINKYDQTQIQDIAIKHTECGIIDGMEGVSSSLLWSLRFPEDLRVIEAKRLLQSSKPVSIALVQRPDVSDHDFIEEQERHLYAICTRTMALPVGR